MHPLQERLDSLRKGQTTVIVAHRLSTVMDADIIIVMQVRVMSLVYCKHPNACPLTQAGTV